MKTKVIKKGLPKELQKFLPTSIDIKSPYLLFPFKPRFKVTGKKFTGFDTLSTTHTHTELKFSLTEKGYKFCAVVERLVDSFSYQTIWEREYKEYKHYENAINYD